MTPISFFNFVLNALSLFSKSDFFSVLIYIFALGVLSCVIYVIYSICEVR